MSTSGKPHRLNLETPLQTGKRVFEGSIGWGTEL